MVNKDFSEKHKFKCLDPRAIKAIRILHSNEGDYDPATARFHIAGLKDGEDIFYEVDHVLPKLHPSLKPANIRYLLHEDQRLFAELSKKIKIERAPGFGLRDFLGHFCEREFREETLEAQHAEGIAYYEELLASGQTRRARIVRYRRRRRPVNGLARIIGALAPIFLLPMPEDFLWQRLKKSRACPCGSCWRALKMRTSGAPSWSLMSPPPLMGRGLSKGQQGD